MDAIHEQLEGPPFHLGQVSRSTPLPWGSIGIQVASTPLPWRRTFQLSAPTLHGPQGALYQSFAFWGIAGRRVAKLERDHIYIYIERETPRRKKGDFQKFSRGNFRRNPDTTTNFTTCVRMHGIADTCVSGTQLAR